MPLLRQDIVLELPPRPSILAGRTNPYLSPADASLFTQVGHQGEKRRSQCSSVSAVVERLSKPPATNAQRLYSLHISQVVGNKSYRLERASAAAPFPALSPPPPSLDALVERMYTKPLEKQSNVSSMLERKYLAPLTDSKVSLTGEQLDEFLERNYRQKSQPRHRSSYGDVNKSDNGASESSPARGRVAADHAQHFYVEQVEETKRSREALLERYLTPTSPARVLSPLQAKASGERLSKV